MNTEVVIDHIGANGDGVAKTKDGLVYVPFTLPGEVVNIAKQGSHGLVMSYKTLATERVQAPCRHYEACGGCALQHWDMQAYQQWKRGLVVSALKGRGLDVSVAPVISCQPAARRRITLTARQGPNGQIVGFHRYHSHDIVAISECAVAHPEIVNKLADIRAIAAVLAHSANAFRLTVIWTDNGLDIALSDCQLASDQQRLKLTDEALKRNIARLTLNDEIIVEVDKPTVHFGRVGVKIPSGGFLQATSETEQKMADLVVRGLKKAKNAADLFCGAGTFSFRLAEFMTVHAVENDKRALAALDRAARQKIAGYKTVNYEQRDLFRRPLSAKELAAFDGLVFDPPRAGAEEQAKEIAKTTIPYVVAVSCNPVTLARDLRILVDGGYQLKKIFPIDQFLWSPHCEVVVFLTKRKPKPGWTL